jgi:hypothetical protein
MIKEMTVMESCRRANDLDFRVIFGQFDENMHPLIPRNRPVARFINKCINSWIDSLQKRILFPKVGSKTISKKTVDEVYALDENYIPNEELGITPIDLERLYHKHGIKIQGPAR